MEYKIEEILTEDEKLVMKMVTNNQKIENKDEINKLLYKSRQKFKWGEREWMKKGKLPFKNYGSNSMSCLIWEAKDIWNIKIIQKTYMRNLTLKVWQKICIFWCRQSMKQRGVSRCRRLKNFLMKVLMNLE